MWDEKKFFEDFVKESEKVKPEEEFIQKLKKLEPKEKKNRFRYAKYTAAAAAVLLCLGIGTLVFREVGTATQKPEDQIINNIDIQAALDGEQIQSGSIGKGKKDSLSDIISSMQQQNIIITDSSGKELSEEEKERLLKQLEDAETVSKNTQGSYTSYFVKEQQEFEIRIYDDAESSGKVKAAIVYAE